MCVVCGVWENRPVEVEEDFEDDDDDDEWWIGVGTGKSECKQ